MTNLTAILAAAQSRSRTRIITEADARKLIAKAEAAVKELPTELRTKAVYQFQEGVCNAYKYAGESTLLTVRFDADGNATEVTAKRTYAPKRKWGRNTDRLALVGVEELPADFPGGYKQL